MTDARSSPGSAALAEELIKWVEQYAAKICPPGCLPLPAQEREINLFARITVALRGVAQAAPEPAITDAMVEAGARVAATRRGHKDCDHLVATVNAGRVPVWEFYTEEPRAILEAALALSSTEGEYDDSVSAADVKGILAEPPADRGTP